MHYYLLYPHLQENYRNRLLNFDKYSTPNHKAMIWQLTLLFYIYFLHAGWYNIMSGVKDLSDYTAYEL